VLDAGGAEASALDAIDAECANAAAAAIAKAADAPFPALATLTTHVLARSQES